MLAHAVDETRQDLADDVEDIKSGRITRAQVYTVLAVLGGMMTLYQGIVYEKFSLSATWIGIPVWVWAAVAMVLVFVIGGQTSWFKDRQFKTPGWFFAIVILALPLSIVLGLNFTEPTELGGKTPHELAMSKAGYQYNYQATRGGGWYYQSFYTSSTSTSSGGGGGSAPGCSGKNCGYALLAIAVVVLILIMLIASALVAHFWFFSASVLFAIALVIAIQAIRYRPRKQPVRDEYSWR